MNKQNRKGFKAGFLKPSLGVFVVSLVLASAVLFFMNQYVNTYQFLNIPREYFLTNNRDYSSDLIYTLAEENAKQTDDYRIYVLGGSATRRSFISEEYTEQALKDEYGEGYNFVLLSTSMLMSLDNLLIVENLPPDNGCVVLSLNIRRALLYNDTGRFPLTSQYYIDYINHNPIVKNLGLFNKKVYNYTGGMMIKQPLTRVLLAPSIKSITAPCAVEAYSTDYTQRLNDDRIASLVETESRRLEKGLSEQEAALFFDILLDIAKVCEEKNLDLLLMDGPYNIALFRDTALLYGETSTLTQYKAVIREVTEETDAEYADFIWTLDIQNEQYMDIVHLSAYEARKAYTDAFVKSLVCFIETQQAQE